MSKESEQKSIFNTIELVIAQIDRADNHGNSRGRAQGENYLAGLFQELLRGNVPDNTLERITRVQILRLPVEDSTNE